MFFWVLYLSLAALFSFFAYSVSRKRFPIIFCSLFVIVVTPNVSGTSEIYTPSVFDFLFSWIFEGDLSPKPLRSIFLALCIFYPSVFLFFQVKKRFFEH